MRWQTEEAWQAVTTERRNAERAWHVVINAGSGVAAQARVQALRDALPSQVAAHTLRVVRGKQLLSALADAARRARADGGLLVACGGDGTLNAAAQQALRENLPLAVLPGGTYNYYTRSLGLPVDVSDAVARLAQGTLQQVDVGYVNDRPFLVNVSLGLHSQLLRQRERDMSRWGRGQLVSIWSGLRTLFGRYRSRRLLLRGDGLEVQGHLAAMLCSRNAVQLADLALPPPPPGQLCLVHAPGQGRARTLQAALMLLLGRARQAPSIHVELGEQFSVASQRRLRSRLHLAVDGELLRLPGPLQLRVAESALTLAVPPATAVQEAAQSPN
ncbi:MAG: hypothetical protein KDI37_04565 [Xanthomonadales bacterium]|nr:hypothetical protein [Xanthomonadales bacterium]